MSNIQNDLWIGAAKDFIAKHKPTSWGKDEQVAVTYTAITEGLQCELSDEDEKHILAVLTRSENTSACAQLLRGMKLIPQAEKKGTVLGNKYLNAAGE